MGGEFIVISVRDADAFTIRVLNPKSALESFAADASRFTAAAYETLLGLRANPTIPRSTAWLGIQAYYAAFFAAHSLLRIIGTGCTQLDEPQITKIERNANALGQMPPGISGFSRGLYRCHFDAAQPEIRFERQSSAARGSHEILWSIFADHLNHVGAAIVQQSAAFRPFAAHLWDLEALLREGGHNDGGWLSHIRNRMNYRHEFGAWHPYLSQVSRPETLLRIIGGWSDPPLSISLPSRRHDEVKAFVSACTLIASLCNCTVCDMEERCPQGLSFQSQCALPLARQAGAL
jgi:hypothetical protein